MTYKNNPAVNARVEWLGWMNDRRIEALARNDEAELEKIAVEYAERGMVVTANEVRLAVKLRKEINHAER